MSGAAVKSEPNRLARIADSYRSFVEPRVSGLPNWRVVTWFPAIIVFGAILMIVLNISGTSSGAHWYSFGVGADPQLLVGAPRPIRQDEWLVSQSWIISQYMQGFPAINGTFPGGMDATVLMELPNTDWSTWFRPHMWGYLLFGLDAGIAWGWWIPAIGLVVATYLLVVTLLPRRSLTAAVIACAVFFTPIFQWWYGANALWPAAWSLLAMAGTLWMIRDPRLWVRVIWAVALGWLAVTMAIGLYVPFMLPAVLVFVFFFVGAVLQERPWQRGVLRPLVVRLLPLLLAGVVAVTVVLIWIATRIEVIDAVQSTVYPGKRSVLTGQLLASDPFLAAFAGAPFGQTFATGSAILGPNPSEAATAILLALFVLPAMVWFTVRRWRAERRVDWLLVGAMASVVLILAFLFIPGWDALARLLLLDRVPVTRYRMGFAVLMPLFFALIAREVDRSAATRTWPLAVVSGGVALAFTGTAYLAILFIDPLTFASSTLWPVAVVAMLAGVVLLFFRRTIWLSAVSLLVASLVIGAAVNPFYRGAFDLNRTDAGREIQSIETDQPGVWLGIGSAEVMALLMQSGVEAYSGMQTYPPSEMWENIDPDRQYEEAWNRLAHVRWQWGVGDPVSAAPYPDALVTSFDPCSEFGQKHVNYVLANEPPLSMECLIEVADIAQGRTDIQIYRVVPAA